MGLCCAAARWVAAATAMVVGPGSYIRIDPFISRRELHRISRVLDGFGSWDAVGFNFRGWLVQLVGFAMAVWHVQEQLGSARLSLAQAWQPEGWTACHPQRFSQIFIDFQCPRNGAHFSGLHQIIGLGDERPVDCLTNSPGWGKLWVMCLTRADFFSNHDVSWSEH